MPLRVIPVAAAYGDEAGQLNVCPAPSVSTQRMAKWSRAAASGS